MQLLLAKKWLQPLLALIFKKQGVCKGIFYHFDEW